MAIGLIHQVAILIRPPIIQYAVVRSRTCRKRLVCIESVCIGLVRVIVVHPWSYVVIAETIGG